MSDTPLVPIFTALRGMTANELRLFLAIKLLEELTADGQLSDEGIDIDQLGELCGFTRESMMKAIGGLSQDWHLLPVPQIQTDGTIEIDLTPKAYTISLKDARHGNVR